MADSVTGIPVFTLADLRVAGAGANVIGGTTDNDLPSGDPVVVRSRWNERAVVIVRDHPADQGDGAERAIFVNHSLNNAWRLGNAKLGTAQTNDTAGAVDGVDIVIPQ